MNANFIPVMGNYGNTEPFRFWCQKVLPNVYDDSLSYYELLTKVVEYLNQVINDLNVCEGNITELAKAYAQLEEFVNDYFKNVDVQQEINDKLDEMVLSGQLADYFSRYMIRKYNTALDLIADTYVTTGELCETFGSTSVADGYGCKYLIEDEDTLVSLKLSNGKYARPICDIYHTRYSKIDNSHDNEIFQGAFDMFGHICIDPGSYTITTTIYAGRGDESTRIKKYVVEVSPAATVRFDIPCPYTVHYDANSGVPKYVSYSGYGINFNECDVEFSGGLFEFNGITGRFHWEPNPIDFNVDGDYNTGDTVLSFSADASVTANTLADREISFAGQPGIVYTVLSNTATEITLKSGLLASVEDNTSIIFVDNWNVDVSPYLPSGYQVTKVVMINFYKCSNVALNDVNCDFCFNAKMFSFEDCDYIVAENVHLDGGSYTTEQNVTVKNTFGGLCVLNSAKSFLCSHSSFKNFFNTADDYGSCYCYPVCTGFSRLKEGDSLIPIFKVSNCNFENCNWEGVDTHGSKCSTIENCYFHNCRRFATFYHDGRVKFTDDGGVGYFVNNYCVNDDEENSEIKTEMAIFIGTSRSYRYDKISIQNCYFECKQSAEVLANFQDIDIENTIIDCKNSIKSFVYASYAKVSCDGVEIRNINNANGAIYVYRGLLYVKNCRYVRTNDYTGTGATYAFSADMYSALIWDNVGVTKDTANLRGVATTLPHLLPVGYLANGYVRGNLNVNCVVAANSGSTFGFVKYDPSFETSNEGVAFTAEQGSKVITIPAYMDSGVRTKNLNDLKICEGALVEITVDGSDPLVTQENIITDIDEVYLEDSTKDYREYKVRLGFALPNISEGQTYKIIIKRGELNDMFVYKEAKLANDYPSGTSTVAITGGGYPANYLAGKKVLIQGSTAQRTIQSNTADTITFTSPTSVAFPSGARIKFIF